jgi:murein DD-endopeptidase MepM/ murein hydrolase activator NlpD
LSGRLHGRSRPGACAFAAALLSAGLALAGPAPPAQGGERTVRPGTLLRWAGEGIEACALDARRFAPVSGACLYPVDLLHPAGPLTLRRWREGRREQASARVGRFDYPLQRLTLPPGMVELSPQDAARVRREQAQVAPLWARDGPRLFALPLRAPLDPLPEGGRFGSRRIINGRPRSPHGGSDYSVAAGTPVRAAADGVVALVAEHFFGGNSVFLDHGDGLITMYFHLSRVDVAEGQQLQRGERIGAVGSSGRATGPHLHFGVRWRGARIDPAPLLGDPALIPALD